MNIAISNLAWDVTRDHETLSILGARGIAGLELAPAKNFGELTEVSNRAVIEYRERIKNAGLEICAFQAFLFGHPELRLFDDDFHRPFIDFNKRVIELAELCGAGRLVYGAPKSRDRLGRGVEECHDIAVRAFTEIGRCAEDHGVIYCLEANPEVYGCSYIYNARQAAELVRDVDSPGFQLHLDTACMTLAGDDIAASIKTNSDILKHFHASEPQLGDFSSPKMNHAAAAAALREIEYRGWVSIEMKQVENQPFGIEQAIGYALENYS